MRYALLDFLACQHCHAELACFTASELDAVVAQGPSQPGTRVSAGIGLGPLPPSAQQTPLHAILARTAGERAEPARNFAVEIERGLLVCGQCGRWYPIIARVPEVLPDHLRDGPRDADAYRAIRAALPVELAAALDRFSPGASAAADAGAHHKKAEMSIKGKIDDPAFFGPGYSSPFNPWNPEFTLYLISLFGAVLNVLQLRKGETVLDSGCGYAWTTEWFHRAGVPVVGVDITRTYLDIAIERMGPATPPLVVGDVEHLPLRTAGFDSVLAYESFHHIPDRCRAMASYDRILGPSGRVVLAEPGADHERAKVSVDAMQKYGILERGMELQDVQAYAAGTRLSQVEQVLVLRTTGGDLGRTLERAFMKSHSIVEGNVFRLQKQGVASLLASIRAPRRRIWPVLKRHIKSALLKVGLD